MNTIKTLMVVSSILLVVLPWLLFNSWLLFTTVSEEEALMSKYRHMFVSVDDLEAIVSGGKLDNKRLGSSTQTQTQTQAGDTCAKTGPAAAPASQALTELFKYGQGCSTLVTTETEYNACCNSTRQMITPITGVMLNDKVVKIVQSDDLKQMFITESCEQNQSCTFPCKCQNTVAVSQALVTYKGGPPFVTPIKYTGCCKCINT